MVNNIRMHEAESGKKKRFFFNKQEKRNVCRVSQSNNTKDC